MFMKIAVCIKQVPDSSEVEVDPVTGTLKRDGVDSKLNPYDLYALETAIRMREAVGGEVTALTMGPPQAAEIIREAYMTGADRGYVISDRKFAGSDVLATSRTISQAVLALGGFDVIFCGKQTTDGDTAQVGSELAEFLKIPHVANVLRILNFGKDGITLESDFPCHVEKQFVHYPCLIAVEKSIGEPRLPSYRLKQATKDREVKFLSIRDFKDIDPMHYGQSGSPTQVIRIFPPVSDRKSEDWNGSADDLSARLYSFLEENKYLQKIG